MLFQIGRIIAFVALALFCVYKIHGSGNFRKKSVYVLSVFLCLILVTISAAFPPENLVIHFESPEQLFSYVNSGEIIEVIYGEDSCLILYSHSDGTISHYIVPQKNHNYVIPNVFSSRRISHKFDETGMIDVYHVKDTKDWYVFCALPEISGNRDVEIYNGSNERIEAPIINIENSNFIYFSLNSITDEHYVLHNGQHMYLID